MQNTNTAHESADNSNIALARSAANGDLSAREKVNSIAHPFITYQSDQFCKRFCAENRHLYRCTLQTPWGSAPDGALLCEWGNASYAWMLNDLTNEHRLRQFKGENGARLQDYLFRIANSLPFYERWKNWRFGRRVNVPDYIREIAPDASRIFLALRSKENIAQIAQTLNKDEPYIDNVAQQIIVTLTRRKRLHLLNPETETSISGANLQHVNVNDGDTGDMDIPALDPDPELRDDIDNLRGAWQQLDAVEQFVLEAMLVEEQDANDVLAALAKLDIRINPKIAPQDTDRQQLYYFRRKTLAKLTGLME